MATKTSLNVKMKDANNNTLQKAITYANPAATNSVLAQFSEKLINDLTTNTYIDADRIDKISLTEAVAAEGGI